MAENIIKYNVPKDKNGVTYISGGRTVYGDSSNSSASTTNADSLWQKSQGIGSLVPTNSTNLAAGINSIAIGTNTQTNNEGELAIGQYNLSTPQETLFSVGDGLSDTERHNVFEVGVGGIKSTNGKFSGLLDADQIQAISGYIQTLLSDEITCDYLTVTKAAHFFKLIIDEIKASQGAIIITPANAILDKVTSISGGWRCYYRGKDSEGRQKYNSFEVNDQVVCETFDAATGTSYDVSNQYYWRLVTNVGTKSTFIFNSESVESTISNAFGGGDGLTYDQIKAITSIGTIFANSAITGTFDEFKYFTGVTTIEDSAFKRCSISSLSLPSTITSIAKDGLRYCRQMTALKLNEGLTSIGQYALRLITKLSELTIPSTVTSLGKGAISYNTNLQTLYFKNPTPITIDDEMFTDCPNLKAICVPVNSVEQYKTTWRRFADLIIGYEFIDDSETLDENGVSETYHYFDLSASDCDRYSMTPKVGDNCVQLGNRTDTTRQAAIVISAYNSQFLDKGLKAPSITQYAGINDYDLSTHRLNVISNGLNVFKGSYNNNSGKNIETIITETATTLDGKIVTLSGTVTSHTQSISELRQTDTEIKGTVSSHTQSIGTLNSNVGALSGSVSANTTNISTLSQTASALTSTVSSHTQTITNISGDVKTIKNDYVTSSKLQQTASSITANITDALGDTGIDITSNNITLKAGHTTLENVASGGATWLQGNINGSCKFLLGVNSYKPVIKLGDNACSSWQNTFLDTETIHIRPSSSNNYATMQVVDSEPAIFLNRGNYQVKIWIDSSGKLHIKPSSKSMWISDSERTSTSSGEIYADDDGFLKINNWS